MTTLRAACRSDGDDTLVAVRVTPGAKREGPGGIREVPGAHTGRDATAVVVWHVRARAVEGQANAALVRSVARAVGVRPSAVEIVRGERSREKVLRLRGVPLDEAVTALSGPGGGA